VAGMIRDAAFPFDQVRNSRRGPQASSITQCSGTLLKPLFDLPALVWTQAWLAPCAACLLQSRTAFLL
jgi:hypothetical protein